jgi:hypothetical protein
MIKALKKLRIEGAYLNTIKTIHDKPESASYSGEKKSFPLKSGSKRGCPRSSLLINIVLEFLVRAIRQEKEIKKIQIGKEEVKLLLLANDMFLRFS